MATINIKIEDNILIDEFALFWKGNSFHSSTELKGYEDKVSNISALNFKIEYEDQGLQNAIEIEEKLIKKISEFYKQSYLYLMDHKPFLKSRIRNFKGVFSEAKIAKQQEEINIGEKSSVIAEILDLKKHSENISKYLNKNELSFIFLSLSEKINLKLLKEILHKGTSINSLAELDYLNIISFMCSNNEFILRKGNYPNDSFLSIQLFFNKRYSDMIHDILDHMQSPDGARMG